ncbi:MAG: flavin oxidoreductase/NADH oxidase [Clostridia bacterium]|nr:flavin oxidoreductase/NADH oxidase [Clostridia bacterium]
MNVKVPKSKQEFLTQCTDAAVTLPYADDLTPLAKPLTIGTKVAPNRIAYQPMEGCDGTPSGCPDTLTIRRYDRFACGGAGLVWVEAMAVAEEGRANPRQLYFHDGNADDFARLVERIKTTCLKENGYEPIVIAQLTHSGRYSKPEGERAPMIACRNPLLEQNAPCTDADIVTDDYLDALGESLISAAARAERAGFDGADIKCCHRYLLCELLSSYSRPGKYGGSFENRTRLLRESVKGSLQACGRDFIVTSRLNLYDGYEYPLGFGTREGYGIEPDYTEAIALVKELASYGVKLLNFTMGNPYFNPHVNRPYARGGYEQPEHPMVGCARMSDGIATVAREIPSVAVISSALSYMGTESAHVAAACVENDRYAMAGFGRLILAYPDLARDILRDGKLYPEKICMACSMCTQIMRQKGGTPGCVIRDAEVYAPIYKELVKK